MTKYVVTAPYVTLKTLDQIGGRVLVGLYRGAPVPQDADADDVKRLLGKGMLGVAEAPAEPEPVAPAPLDPLDEDGKPVRPADNANKPVWVEYAVLKRGDDMTEDAARAAAEGMSKADLIKTFG